MKGFHGSYLNNDDLADVEKLRMHRKDLDKQTLISAKVIFLGPLSSLTIFIHTIDYFLISSKQVLLLICVFRRILNERLNKSRFILLLYSCICCFWKPYCRFHRLFFGKLLISLLLKSQIAFSASIIYPYYERLYKRTS